MLLSSFPPPRSPVYGDGQVYGAAIIQHTHRQEALCRLLLANTVLPRLTCLW
jgi:hypothetical protein